MKTPKIWIDNPDNAQDVGQIGFVLHRHNENNGTHSRWLSLRPAQTNRSGAAKLHGWCGTTNNLALFAEGMARIEAVNTETERAKLCYLTADETRAALEETGYPELIAEIEL